MSAKSPALSSAGRGEDKAKTRPSQQDLESAVAAFEQYRDTPMYQTLIEDFAAMAGGELREEVAKKYPGWSAEDFSRVLDELGEWSDEALE